MPTNEGATSFHPAGSGGRAVVLRRKAIGQVSLSSSLDARFRGPLMSFFLRRIGHHADAEELTQQVFVRILAANDRLRIEDAEGFVFKVASNLLRDRARQGARRGGDHTPLDEALIGELAREFMEDRSPERVLLGQESLSDVLAALDELGQRTRDIFILFKVENMKQREIAAIYGISPSTVEKDVMRATLHLTLKFGSHRPAVSAAETGRRGPPTRRGGGWARTTHRGGCREQ